MNQPPESQWLSPSYDQFPDEAVSLITFNKNLTPGQILLIKPTDEREETGVDWLYLLLPLYFCGRWYKQARNNLFGKKM